MADGWAEVFGEIGHMAEEAGKQLIYLAGVCARLKAKAEEAQSAASPQLLVSPQESIAKQRAAVTKAVFDLLRKRYPASMSHMEIVATLAPMGAMPQAVRSAIANGVKVGVLEPDSLKPTYYRSNMAGPKA
jgi:hypothetical protein